MFQCSDLRALLNLCRPYGASQSPVGATEIWQAVERSGPPATTRRRTAALRHREQSEANQ